MVHGGIDRLKANIGHHYGLKMDRPADRWLVRSDQQAHACTHRGVALVRAREAVDEAMASDPSHMRTARQYALSLRSRERWGSVALTT